MSTEQTPDQQGAHVFDKGEIMIGVTANNPHIGEMNLGVILARYLESMGGENIHIETQDPDQFGDALDRYTDDDVKKLLEFLKEHKVKLTIRTGIGGRPTLLTPAE